MTKRYFYTDPLAAAWMADKFGMRFANDNGVELEWCNEFNCFHEPDLIELSQAWDGRHYIHSDSLHLLEPQIGDLIRGSHNKVAMYFDGNTRPKSTAHVVQRSGIPFMWPECEEA